MGRGLESVWTRTRNSAAWRAVMRLPGLRRLFRSAGFDRLDTWRKHALSRWHLRRHPSRYADIHTLCLMIGHTKSGGSLLGALLDAHPHVAFADEIDVLAWFDAGFEPEQIFWLLERGARREAMKGRVTARRLEPYSLAVPDQHQGRSTRLRVVGDSKAGITTQRLGSDHDVLTELESSLGRVRLRLIHVVRNPFDPMSAMMLRGGRSFSSAFDRYFSNCEVLADLHARLPAESLSVVRYEDVTVDPVSRLRELCAFLGIEAEPAWLRACAEMVDQPPPERTRVDWAPAQISQVMDAMTRHSFLEGYAFADRGVGGT